MTALSTPFQIRKAMADNTHNPAPILIVEDERLLRDLYADALRNAGHAVVAIASAQEAIDLLSVPGSAFAGILCDIRLGADALTGWDVVRHARRLNNAIAAIYISGDSGHLWQQEAVPDSLFLQKPFSRHKLLAAFAKVLDRSMSQMG